MSTKTRSSKGRSRKASKRERSKSIQVSVTGSDGVTLTSKETPSIRYAKLRLWLELTNLLPPPKLEPIPERPGARLVVFPPEPPGEFLQRAEATGLPKALGLGPPIAIVTGRAGRLIKRSMAESVEERGKRAERLYNLAKQVARSLRYSAGKDYGLNIESLDAGTAGIEIRGGRIATRLVNPLADFLVAFENAEASRVRNCPICGHVFYARRLTQEACSQRCNATRRVRAWRAKHGVDYEYNRKLKLAGVKSEPEARQAKPRKEHRK